MCNYNILTVTSTLTFTVYILTLSKNNQIVSPKHVATTYMNIWWEKWQEKKAGWQWCHVTHVTEVEKLEQVQLSHQNPWHIWPFPQHLWPRYFFFSFCLYYSYCHGSKGPWLEVSVVVFFQCPTFSRQHQSQFHKTAVPLYRLLWLGFLHPPGWYLVALSMLARQMLILGKWPDNLQLLQRFPS
jgi:hypothetical protein